MSDTNQPNEPMSNVTPIKDYSAMGKKSAEKRTEAARAAGILPRVEDEKSRWQQLIDGDIEVSDLDDEELKKMRTRDRLGGFTGRPSKNIPRKLDHAMRQELLSRGQRDLENALPIAIATLSEIAARGLGKDRLVAAQLILERGLGKVPDKVELTQHSSDPWEDVLQGVISQDNLERLKDAAGQ